MGRRRLLVQGRLLNKTSLNRERLLESGRCNHCGFLTCEWSKQSRDKSKTRGYERIV